MEEGKIAALVKDGGCNPRLAKLLLEFTEGDVSGARKILDAVSKTFAVVKVRFIAQKTFFYGTMIFVYDLEKKF